MTYTINCCSYIQISYISLILACCKFENKVLLVWFFFFKRHYWQCLPGFSNWKLLRNKLIWKAFEDDFVVDWICCFRLGCFMLIGSLHNFVDALHFFFAVVELFINCIQTCSNNRLFLFDYIIYYTRILFN